MSLSCVLYVCFSFLLFHFHPIFVLFVTISAVLFHCFKAGGEVLRISSDRDDQRIFVGLKFFHFRIFLGKKILASIFGGSLIEVGIFVST